MAYQEMKDVTKKLAEHGKRALLAREQGLKLYKHLCVFRATPHPTTGAIQGSPLFGTNICTKMPNLRDNREDNKQDIKLQGRGTKGNKSPGALQPTV